MWIVNNSQESLSLLAFEAHPDVKEGQPKTAQLFFFRKKFTKKYRKNYIKFAKSIIIKAKKFT